MYVHPRGGHVVNQGVIKPELATILANSCLLQYLFIGVTFQSLLSSFECVCVSSWRQDVIQG